MWLVVTILDSTDNIFIPTESSLKIALFLRTVLKKVLLDDGFYFYLLGFRIFVVKNVSFRLRTLMRGAL